MLTKTGFFVTLCASLTIVFVEALRPLSIVEVSNGTLLLNQPNLETIFDQIEDANTEVAILSIAGEYRKGKSFLLNFFLQYLKYRSSHPEIAPLSSLSELQNVIQQENHPWLRAVDRDSGFHFQSGVKRDTTGITMWPEPFVIKKSDGKLLAVIVMDSQGLHDSSTSTNDNVRIFAMVSLLSSSLMLNTAGNINSKHLLELKSFLDYATTGSLVINGTKPFQRLTFLIRDYSLGSHGWDGGQEVLDQFMQPNGDQSNEVQKLARNLTDSFYSIDAFTLPFPGRPVTRKDYNGSLSLVDVEFLQHLESFVINITEALEPRKPLLAALKAENIVGYVKEVIETLNDKHAPDVLMRLNERNLVISVFETTQMLLQAYDSKMQHLADAKNDSYYLKRDISQIIDDISRVHEETASMILEGFETQPFAHSIFEMGPNGTMITAIQYLRKQLEDRSNKILPKLIVLAEKRINEAVLKERYSAAREKQKQKMEEDRKRIEIEREAFQNYIKVQIEKERQKREETFWEKLVAFFKSLYARFSS